MGLLGAALLSMSFLFAVTFSQASFSQVYQPLPDVFAPANVVASLDQVSHDYAIYVQKTFIARAQSDYALAADNIAFIAQEDGPQFAYMLGLSGSSQSAPQPQVAGASTQINYSPYYSTSNSGFSVDSILRALSIN